MATRSSSLYTRRSRLPQYLAGGFFGLLLLLGGTSATLALLGFNLNPFATKAEDPYMVRIPINAKAIPAYSRVDRTHLLNPASGSLMFQKVPPRATLGMSITGIDAKGSHVEGTITDVKRVNDEVVFVVSGGYEVRQGRTIELGGAKMNVNDIIGRVVKKDKRTGLGFREDTFFPAGTPEGIAGATPPGMRAITLDATKLMGVHSLNAGDHIDLMASVAELPSSANSRSPAGDATSLIGATQNSKRGEDQPTQPFMLAQDALVLKPVYVRTEAEASSSLTQGKKLQNIPKYEVAIAVKADDIIPLQSALHKQLAITCIARSMQPGADTEAVPAILPDKVRVPVTVRAILAYEVVSRDAFVSQATRSLRLEEVSRQEVDRMGIVTSLDEVLGSIARHDIPAGRFLRHSDLLTGAIEPANPVPSRSQQNDVSVSSPMEGRDGSLGPTHRFIATYAPQEATGSTATAVGDRPSITRFIPAGRTAFAIPWNRLYGAEHLQIGDTIDLLASYSLDNDEEEEETETRPDGTKIVRKKNSVATRKTERAWDESFGFRGEPWFVATQATVVGPVGFPAPASALRALGESANRGNTAAATNGLGHTGPAIIIAVDALDVELVAAAMATKQALFTVAMHAENDREGTPSNGMKRIAIASEHMAAYSVLDATSWKGNRRSPVTRLVRADDPQYANAVEIEQLPVYFSRTLVKSKSRGDFFEVDDFLAKGSSRGIAGAARPGHTIVAIADREIEGLDSFSDNDWLAVMMRGVIKPPAGVQSHGFNLSRPVASVVVPELRIARSTIAGQTILEVKNEDLAVLQAALASNLSDAGNENRERSHLVAIGISKDTHSGSQREEKPTASSIPGYDPLAGIQTMEIIVGNRRQTHAYREQTSTPSRNLPAVSR